MNATFGKRAKKVKDHTVLVNLVDITIQVFLILCVCVCARACSYYLLFDKGKFG